MENSPFRENIMRDMPGDPDILSALTARQSSAETIRYLQDKIDRASLEHQNALKEKNAVIRDLKNQLASMSEHVKDLKARYDEVSEAVLQEQLLSKVKVEEAGRLMGEQKLRHQRELKLLGELLERSKYEISNLNDRLEKEKKEKESLKSRIQALEAQKADLADKSAMLENNLAQSKKAVEETLSSLFEERKKSSDFSQKVRELENKISGLNKELENTRLNWDAERKEWRELWERERSVWETHRQEFAVWEERLRSEREAWLERLKKEEEKGVDYAQNIARILEDTSKWSDRVTQILKLYASKGVQLPQVFVTPETIKAKTSSGFRKVLALACLTAVLVSSAGWWAYDYSRKLHLSLLASRQLEGGQYTAVASLGDSKVLSTWSDGLIFASPDGKVTKRISDFSGQKLKISALTQANGFLWALDMAQLRFVKIDPETGKILTWLKTAGPAPQGVAFDGFNLWSFDAATGLMYKYSLSGEISGILTYNMPSLKSADALQWSGNEMYAVSNGHLMRYSFKNENFRKISEQKMKNIVSFYIDNGELSALSSGGSISLLDFYRIKNVLEEK